MNNLTQLDDLLAEGEKVLATKYTIDGVLMAPAVNSDIYTAWKTKVLAILDTFPKGSVTRFIEDIEEKKDNRYHNAAEIQASISGIKELIDSGIISFGTESTREALSDLDKIQLLCRRFHKVARSLRNRYSNRNTLIVKDEYDMQDLFGSMLKVFFDDIRKEEYVPSYAGGASRTDFLIPDAGIVIELKKTRTSMKDADLGEQLIVDLERYKAHPQCSFVLCFVYDPDELLSNPDGIMSDLNTIHKNEALVIIEP